MEEANLVVVVPVEVDTVELGQGEEQEPMSERIEGNV